MIYIAIIWVLGILCLKYIIYDMRKTMTDSKVGVLNDSLKMSRVVLIFILVAPVFIPIIIWSIIKDTYNKIKMYFLIRSVAKATNELSHEMEEIFKEFKEFDDNEEIMETKEKLKKIVEGLKKLFTEGKDING